MWTPHTCALHRDTPIISSYTYTEGFLTCFVALEPRHDRWKVLWLSCSLIAKEEEKEAELRGPSCFLGM